MEMQANPQKKWYKKWWVIVIGVLIGIIVLSVIAGRGMPVLKDVPTDVTQSVLRLNGFGVENNATVKIYLNGNLASEIKADSDGNFTTPLTLIEGKNSLYVTASYKDEEEKSSEKTITYTNQEKIDAQDKAEAGAKAVAQEAQQKADEEARIASQQKFVKVISFTGDQSVKTAEFSISSKEVKFVYKCDGGLFLCNALLKQVGGGQQELFHSNGSTGTLTEEKTLSVGPGTFYLEVGARDRKFTIDVFQSTSQVSQDEKNDAQAKIDVGAKYRNVSGFKLTSENGALEQLYYNYETNNGVYRVELDVHPDVTNFKLESDYTLARGSLKINDVDIQYAFNKGAMLNGYEAFKPYEDIELTFVADNKTHIGFVRQVNSREAINKAGIESTMKAFLTALMPNIKGNK